MKTTRTHLYLRQTTTVSSGRTQRSPIGRDGRRSLKHILRCSHLHSIHCGSNADLSQVLKLCGPEPLTKYLVLAVVALQITCAYLLHDTKVLSLPFLLTAYIIGATANQNLFLAIHEISHNLAFKSPLANRICAVFANLPIGIPYSASFRVRRLLIAVNHNVTDSSTSPTTSRITSPSASTA